MTTIAPTEAASVLGRALREARREAGISVATLAIDAPLGTAKSLSPYYDAERGTRFASADLVDCYAKRCRRSDLRDLRDSLLRDVGASSGLDREGRGIVRSLELPPTRIALSTADRELATKLAEHPALRSPYAVLDSADDCRRLAAAMLAQAALSARSWIGPRPLGRAPVIVTELGSGSNLGHPLGPLEDSDLTGAIELAVKAGLRVRHLRPDTSRSATAFDQIRSLLRTLSIGGDYEPLQISVEEQRAPARDVLIVPGVGVLESLATHQCRHVDAGRFFSAMSMPEICAITTDHARQLISIANRVVTKFERGRDSDVHVLVQIERAMRDAEVTPGPRYMFKDGLSTMTCPIAVTDARVERELESRNYDPEAVRYLEELLRIREDRHQAFREQLEDFDFIDVVSRQSLERFASTGSFAGLNRRDDYGLATATPGERVLHLRAEIELLRAYDRYQLIVLDNQPFEEWFQGLGWFVKEEPHGTGSVFFQSVHQDEDCTTYVGCEIRESNTVRAVKAHFLAVVDSNSASIGASRKDAIKRLDEAIRIAEGEDDIQASRQSDEGD